MLKKIILFLLLLLFSQNPLKAEFYYPPLTIEEEDGSPSIFPYKLKVTNGTLTDNSDSTASLSVQSDLTDSASLAAALSDETGTGLAVFGTTPTFTTSLISPLVIGGTTTTSDLSLQTTSGIGATGADMHFLVGNNGATEAMTILNSGNVGIGTTNPLYLFDISKNLNVSNATYLNIENTSGQYEALNIRIADNAGSLLIGRADAGEQLFLAYGSYIRDVSEIGLQFAVGATVGLTIDSSGDVGIGTTGPTNILSLGGNSARTFWMERHTTANTAGNSLTMQAGGATSAATDKAGGDLILAPGTSTGTGKSKIQLRSSIAGTTGTADRAPATHIQISQGHLVSLGTAPTLSACGTTPAVTGNDIAGKITIGTGVTTSCTATFATAYDTSAPSCLAQNNTTEQTLLVSTTTTALTISSATDFSSDVISYQCLGTE